jgi:hypothetical protein
MFAQDCQMVFWYRCQEFNMHQQANVQVLPLFDVMLTETGLVFAAVRQVEALSAATDAGLPDVHEWSEEK